MDRMDIRNSRRCGNVRKLPDPALLWETYLQAVGKDLSFSIACEWVFIGISGSFPHFHDAVFFTRRSAAIPGRNHQSRRPE